MSYPSPYQQRQGPQDPQQQWQQFQYIGQQNQMPQQVMGVGYPVAPPNSGYVMQPGGGAMYQQMSHPSGYLYYQQQPGQNPVLGPTPMPGQNPVLGPTPMPGQNPVMGPTSMPSFPMQFGQQQAQLLHEQQRMMEQQRQHELEEQKKREIELQKRRLQNVNVTKPPSSISSLETLIGFDPKKSPSSKPKHKKTEAEIVSQSPLASSDTKPEPQASKTSNLQIQKPFPEPTKPTGPSIEELMANSMSKLDDKGKRPIKRTDFIKQSQKLSNSPSSQTKQFSSSEKSRSWETGADEFSGLFAQHAPPPLSQQEQYGTNDDSFGEFQSVSSTGPPLPSLMTTGATPPLPMMTGGNTGDHTAGMRVPMSAHMATPSTGSPQLVHSQGHIPLMATGALSERELPSWLISASIYNVSQLPPIYYSVYQMCAVEGSELTNTQTLFPLLVSSGLNKVVLRDLWSLVNRTVPGQLTRTELFTLLGLIGLIQNSGQSTVTLMDLKGTTSPPIPQLAALSQQTTDDFGEFQGTTPSTLSTQSSALSEAPPTLQPALFQPTSGTSSDHTPSQSTTESEDKYSVFRQLNSSSHVTSMAPPIKDQLVPQQVGVSSIDKNDPYAALKGLVTSAPLINTGNEINNKLITVAMDSQPSIELFQSNLTGQPDTNFVPLTSNEVAPELQVTTPTDTGGGWADFTSFTTSQFSQANKSTQNTTLIPTSNPSPAPPNLSLTMTTPPLILSNKSPKDEFSGFGSFQESTIPPVSSMNIPPSMSSSPPFLSTTNSAVLSTNIPLVSTSPPLSLSTTNSVISSMTIPPMTSSPSPSLSSTNSAVLSTNMPLATTSPPLSHSPTNSVVSSTSEVSLTRVKCLDRPDIWYQCLQKCCDLLTQCYTVLSEETDTDVLNEVTNSEDGRNKLRGIIEVYRFSKRIHTTSRGPGKHSMTPSKSESLTELMIEIRRKWNAICKLLPEEALMQIMDSMSSSSSLSEEDAERCQLCLLPSHIFISPLVTIDGCSERYTLATDKQDGRLFHVQCANFWTKGLEQDIELVP